MNFFLKFTSTGSVATSEIEVNRFNINFNVNNLFGLESLLMKNGTSFFLGLSKVSYAEAVSNCFSKGMRLIAIETDAKLGTISSIIKG